MYAYLKKFRFSKLDIVTNKRIVCMAMQSPDREYMIRNINLKGGSVSKNLPIGMRSWIGTSAISKG